MRILDFSDNSIRFLCSQTIEKVNMVFVRGVLESEIFCYGFCSLSTPSMISYGEQSFPVVAFVELYTFCSVLKKEKYSTRQE